MQVDLDHYLVHYNTKRPHQGYGMNGKTPYEVFKKGLAKRPSPSKKKEAKIAA